MDSVMRDELVPYFSTNKSQIIFEFGYLITLFILCISFLLFLQFQDYYVIDRSTRVLLFAGVGGVLGGWTFVAKWFYRVTARGKDNQYGWTWEAHKFYWRILTPPLAGVIAFSVYVLGSAGLVNITIGDGKSAKAAFGLCVVFGYFSDLVMSKLATWVEGMFKK